MRDRLTRDSKIPPNKAAIRIPFPQTDAHVDGAPQTGGQWTFGQETEPVPTWLDRRLETEPAVPDAFHGAGIGITTPSVTALRDGNQPAIPGEDPSAVAASSRLPCLVFANKERIGAAPQVPRQPADGWLSLFSLPQRGSPPSASTLVSCARASPLVAPGPLVL